MKDNCSKEYCIFGWNIMELPIYLTPPSLSTPFWSGCKYLQLVEFYLSEIRGQRGLGV